MGEQFRTGGYNDSAMKTLIVAVLVFVVVAIPGVQSAIPEFLTFGRDRVDGDLSEELSKGIFENTAIGTVIGQLKANDSDGDAVYFTCESTHLSCEDDGIVRVAKEIDKEKLYLDGSGTKLKAVFIVRDIKDVNAPNQPNWISRSISFNVIDQNDNPPVFAVNSYSAVVNENAPVGTTFFTDLVITDADEAQYSLMDVQCYAPPNDADAILACQYFNVSYVYEPKNPSIPGSKIFASLFLIRPLDYEQRKSYVMSLLAVDNPGKALSKVQNNKTVNVGINVIDTQDIGPKFLNTPVILTIQEGVPINTVIGSVTGIDGDIGQPRPVEVFILNDPQRLFRLSETSQNGNMSIIVNSTIDREVHGDEYSFIVKVVELDNGSRTDQTATTVVSVNIRDINDNPPQFSQSVYNVSMRELLSASSNISQSIPLLITVNDVDLVGNNAYTVTIVNSNVPRNDFHLDKNSGSGETLFTIVATDSTVLDYEKPLYRDITLNLRAQEVNGARFSDAVVNIRLIDINDNYPKFTQNVPVYRATLPENTPVGTRIMQIQATDEDSGINGKVVYSMPGTEFRVDSNTGEIFLAKPLDYETATSLERTFIASDSADPPKLVNVPFQLTITNYNDVAPVFTPPSYNTSVFESSKVLRIPVTVQATDRDSSVIRYRLIKGNTQDNAFVINSVTGQLSLSRAVNYNEATNGYFVLVVQADDNGSPPLRTNATITVQVIDQNDQTPVFFPSVYNATISEIAAEGTIVVTINATDGDSGTNGEITYLVDSGGFDNFAIAEPNRAGLVIVSKRANMNFDTVKGYTVILHARDKGGPPKTGTATLYVKITDANNQIPVFNRTNYQTRIKEDVSIGTPALTVNATDKDSTSVLRYSIKQGSHLARKSDGSNILGTFQYDFTKAFVIEPFTGVIKTNQTLKRDGAAEISFIVVVEDTRAENPKPQTAEASVLIIILGRNDTTPYFDGKRTDPDPSYYFQLPENTAVGNLITSLLAIDPTGLPISNYAKVPGSGDPENLFHVNLTNGQIFVNKAPDYEALQSKLQSFKVRATTQDGTRYVDATVNIEIKDVNDNPPVFIKKDYTFRIPEDKDFTYVIGPVIARDADGGSFSAIQYTLFDPVNDDFNIESDQYNQGIIRVKQNSTLDFEKVPVYNLLVFAMDNLPTSTDRKTASVKVTILITDVNDNYPQFTRATYSFFTVETFDIGTSVGLVSATDKDKDNYGQVNYYFEDIPGSQTATGYFEIEQATGLIKIRSNLQGTAANSPYRLRVKAVDNPGSAPQLTNVTTVSINVSSGQIDEGRPVWIRPKPSDVSYINENSNANTLVVQARASARTPGASIIYSILYNDDSRLFKIDNQTGDVTTTQKLDREEKETYSILLLGVDSKNSSLQSTTLLTVTLVDQNDELPSFRNCPDVKYAQPETVSVYENEPRGTYVFQAKACDRDLPPNNQVEYDFFYPQGHPYCFANATEYFQLNELTGMITTSDVLDREKQASYLLCIRANEKIVRGKRQTYDFTNEDHDTILFLHVNVLDINDKKPEFPYDLVTERIFALPKSDKVLQVQAYDGDSSEFNKIRYTITNVVLKEAKGRVLPIYHTPFNINPTTGLISVALKSYMTFVGGYFNLTIRAEDSKNISMWDSVVVKIFVLKDYYQARVVIPTKRFGDDVQAYVDQMLNELNTQYPGYLFKDTIVRYHKTLTGTSIDRTDVCMVVIQKDQVLDSYQATRELNKVNDVLNKYGYVDIGPCEPVSTSRLEGWVAFWWVLVAFAIFIFIVSLILIYAIWALYRNYKNYMNTQKTYLVQ